MAGSTTLNAPQPAARRRYAWAPWFVLCLSMIGAAFTAWLVNRTTEIRDRAEFRQDVLATVHAIDHRMREYTAMLRATAGLFNASGLVDHAEFKRFVDRLELERYPGIQGIGFSQRYLPEEADVLLQVIREQGAVQGLWPESIQDQRHAIVYLEPLDARNLTALGFDMYSGEVRRAAMMKARETGEPAASGSVTLVQEIAGQIQAGFLIYVPVYNTPQIPEKEQRADALVGFAYAAFRADDLLRSVMDELDESAHVALRVYDGRDTSRESLLHESPVTASADFVPRFTSTHELEVAGRVWTIVARSRRIGAYEQVDLRSILTFVLAGGLSLLLAAVTWSQTRARRDAEATAARLRQSREALRASEQRLRLIFGHAALGIAQVGLHGEILDANQSLCEMLQLERSDLVGRRLGSIIHPEDHDPGGISRLLIGEIDTYRNESRFVRRDGSTVWANLVVSTVRDAASKPQYLIMFVEDISERKRFAEHQTLLIQELNHRVKNSLAVVLAIASQTLERSDSLPAFARAFEGRIRAMARTHALLTRRQWRPASLEEVVRTAIEPFERDLVAGRVEVDGPPLLMPPEAAISFSMVLHELATNAMKYGALSVPHGRLRVTWEIVERGRDRFIRFEWREIDGPATEAPTRHGFGRYLIERSITYELAGETRFSFEPTGLVFEALIPWTDAYRSIPGRVEAAAGAGS